MNRIGVVCIDAVPTVGIQLRTNEIKPYVDKVVLFTQHWTMTPRNYWGMPVVAGMENLKAWLENEADSETVLVNYRQRIKDFDPGKYPEPIKGVWHELRVDGSTAYSVDDFKGMSTILGKTFLMLAEDFVGKELRKAEEAVEEPVYERKSGKVIVGLASYPARETGMIAVVRSVAPQCDEMHVALNEYDGEALENVLKRLEPYKNVVVTVYRGEADLGCQNKFRAVDVCGPNDYFLTVDDDLVYPRDYVNKLVGHINRYDGKKIVSFHGKMLGITNGRISSPIYGRPKSVLMYSNTLSKDTVVQLAGNGVAGTMPARIGLNFNVFVAAKNTGDDELLAIWAQKHGIESIVVQHPANWIVRNAAVENIQGMWRDPTSKQRRAELLTGFTNWRTSMPVRSAPFFGIVVPVYRSSSTLKRALQSIVTQNFDDYVVSVCDDMSGEPYSSENKKLVETILSGRRFVFTQLQRKGFAGGARNAAARRAGNTEYILFLDADDEFADNQVLHDLKEFILSAGMPDCVVLPSFKVRENVSTVKKAASIKTVEDLAVSTCFVEPWSKCIRTSGLQPFVEGMRRSNDVQQHLRTLDTAETLAVFTREVVKYNADGETTMFGSAGWANRRTADALACLFKCAADALGEQYEHEYMRHPVAGTVRCCVNMIAAYMRDLKDPKQLDDLVKITKTP